MTSKEMSLFFVTAKHHGAEMEDVEMTISILQEMYNTENNSQWWSFLLMSFLLSNVSPVCL